jgi:PiT family inorganic phosphate transporter
MIGGLIGSTVAAANDNWGVVIWPTPAPGRPWYGWGGLLFKVVIPMFTSPMLGFIFRLLFMALLYFLVAKWRPRVGNAIFGKLQLASAAYMGFSHGSDAAQKTMGIIALALFSATKARELDSLPPWLSFLKTPEFTVAVWVKVLCALTMAAGTAAGGWRIISTLGHKMVRMHPIHGFAAETTAATVLITAAELGMPVSTTHAISTSIIGLGTAKNLKAVRWELVERILWTWFLTLPATGFIAYALVRLVNALGMGT